MSEVTLSYERKISDGNYGSEGMHFTITTNLPDDISQELAVDVVKDLLRTTRMTVLQGLAESASRPVKNDALSALEHHGYPMPPGGRTPAPGDYPEMGDSPF